MADNNTIIYEANVYVSNTKTVKETVEELGISKRTLQLHFKRLENINKNLYDDVRRKQAQNIDEGRIKGGKSSKATPSYTKEEATEIANYIVHYGVTYEEASEVFNVPKSTIYEMTHSKYVDPDLIRQLELLADANRHDMTVEDYKRENPKR